jgi:CDP-diacylglycerol--glycerol-3-phosphate 3-phosphatidyltransferase
LPSIYDLKPKFQNLLRPVCAALAKAGVTANQVTLAALFLSVGEGAWIAVTHAYALAVPDAYVVGVSASWQAWGRASLIALPFVLFARMALNAIDGMLAREWNQKTQLGAVLNEAGDIVSDVALYLPFALILSGIDSILVVLIVVLAVFTELGGIASQQWGFGGRRYDGPFGKSDRAFFFGAFAVVLAIGISPGLWSTIVLGAAALLCAITVINRMIRGLIRRPQQ